ncbi:S-layer homology domain-containing protein [Rossellomorea sp. YZS02]|uniref:S-layer homology domain-containing protein n=1 Tax=Rossellomorea sp. YZS02 TaxID=3097358 RepID=UPI002A148D08|nr:S-layer homology domain-containing protein [Rossellomorea sp. YZS02]MDX8343149.1 S-layer homology domain-containing protein [Rossellomorea sp. YZS02]
MKGKKIKKQMLSATVASSMALGLFAPPLSQQVSAAEEGFQDLIISEYIEGSSYNKAIELYNGTGADIDLSEYSLELHTNGAETTNVSLTLSGILSDGDVFVVASNNDKTSTSILDHADLRNGTVINFNGNDPITLKKNDTVIDSIGQVGSDVKFGENVTLVRKDTVVKGDTDITDSFDPSIEWNSFSQDTFDYLGSHLSGETPTDPTPVELTSIAEARTAPKGTPVKVQGTATAAFEAGGQTNLFIQDDTAGVIIRGSGLTAQPGDEVIAEGTLADYYGMQQIEVSASNVEIATKDKGIPSPTSLISTDLSAENGEPHEGTFVEFTDVTIDSKDSNGNFTATDDMGQFVIKPSDSSLLEIGKKYEILRGVIDYNYNEYKLVPRNSSDVIETAFSVTANPESGSVTEGTKITLQTATTDGVIHFTTDGTTPTASSPEYTAPIELTSNTTIKAVVTKDNETSEIATFTYNILKSADGLSIHDIQGDSHTSPYESMNVSNVQGIVTAKAGSNAFYMQEETPDDNEATSEGIYVYAKANNVKVGDKVNVSGQVKEWREDGYSDAKDLLTTQITASAVSVESSDNTVPAPIVIGKDRMPPTEVVEDDEMMTFDPETDGLDFYESLEGMLIEIPDATITGPVKYDELPVIASTSEDQLRTRAGGILISPEDYNPERMLIDVGGININAKTGDTLSGPVTGNVSYDYSNFKIRPAGTFPTVVDGGTEREVTTITPVNEDLTIASYNIENFYAGIDPGKVEKIAQSIVKNMKTPDIIGLVEVQDNNGPDDDGTTDASASYETIIKAIEEAGGPTYEFTDIAPADKTDGGQPGGNIRVGFIYNPQRVQLTDKAKGDAVTSVGVDENGLTQNPGRVDPMNEAFDDSRKPLAAEFMFNGEKVIVVANHFNSKGGDGALFGADHPVVLGSEVQRIKQAKIINDFVTNVNDKVEDANVVVLGDLNDFEFSNPLKTLKGDILTDMMEKLPVEQRYSYIYQGNSQVLDHILVTNNLVNSTMIDSININSDFSEEDGRASDHDPVLAKIHFEDNGGTPTDPTPTEPEDGKLTIELDSSMIVSGVQKLNDEKVSQLVKKYSGEFEQISFELSEDAHAIEVSTKVLQALKDNIEATVIEVKTAFGTYMLPINELDVQNIESAKIVVKKVTGTEMGNLNVVSPVVEFKVVVNDGEKEVDLSHFDQFVKRGLMAAQEVDPSKAVAVMIKEDGTIRAVPTLFEGKNALIMSQTNSRYAIVQMDKTFKDVNDGVNWAEEYIETLASKHIIYGKTSEFYSPDADMTRGEFAALISRSLGLVADAPYAGQFKDVSGNEAVNKDGELVAALEVGIIKGKEDGTFKPYEKISRAEAAIMIARAMDFVGYDEADLDTEKGSEQYKDSKYMSNEAQKALNLATQAGVMNGMSGGVFKPNDYTKRDQMAKIIAETLRFVKFMN